MESCGEESDETSEENKGKEYLTGVGELKQGKGKDAACIVAGTVNERRLREKVLHIFEVTAAGDESAKMI